MTIYQNRPYPVQEFPPELQSVFYEIKDQSQAPDALIMGAMLASISHACQHAIAVKRGPIVTPVCLNVILIADSGERKSAVEKLVMAANFDFARQKRLFGESQLKSFEASEDIWIAQRKGLMSKLKSAVKGGLASEEIEEIEFDLKQHVQYKPEAPVVPKMLYTDTTIEALLQGLHGASKSAMLISAEGATIFFGPAIRSIDKLNILWDGGELHVDRKDSSFTVENAKLTTSIMIQSAPFLKFQENRGEMARGLGYFARSLISYPPSTQGKRFINNLQEFQKVHLPGFHRRITELLSTDTAGSQCKVVSLSHDAMCRWLAFYNQVESNLSEGGYLADIRDFASKIADNVARIAALFHHYSGNDGEISLDSVNRACNIAVYYINEFKALFGAPVISKEQLDAQMLEDWLHEQFKKSNNIFPIPKQRLRTYGPNPLRNAGRLNSALHELAMSRKIQIGRQGKTEMIIADFNYFNAKTWQHGSQLPSIIRPSNIHLFAVPPNFGNRI